MATSRFAGKLLAAAAATVLVLSCTPQTTRDDYARATVGYIQDVNKLLVVDCLLPGQVRKLGSQLTYVSARRPIRTTAADCEVRGGEYVAYDRANYASALKVWEPQANSGDASAQLYVGEIYEKGLGRAPDYKAAALWYHKSADQGNQQAQVNLGHLYEKGLGVPKDTAAASRYYAKASGLEAAGLRFASASSVFSEPPKPELSATPESSPYQSAETRDLRAQLREAHRQILDQQKALRDSQDELEASRRRLTAEKSGRKLTDSSIQQREAELARKESQLRVQQSRLEAVEQQRSETDLLRKQLSDAQQRLTAQQASMQTTHNELEILRGKVNAEKAAPRGSGVAAHQLENELRQKEAQLRMQQAKLDEATASLSEERRRTAKELSQSERQRTEVETLRAQLRISKDELEAARRSAPSEKQASATDDSATRQLQEELQRKELLLRKQQAKLDESTASFKKEQQRMAHELKTASQRATPPSGDASENLPDTLLRARKELLESENALSEKMGDYQKESSELTTLLMESETTSVDQSREEIQARKRDLATQASEINVLQEKVEAQSKKVAELEQAGPILAAGGPRIEILQPAITLTRGTPTIQLHPGTNEIIGRVAAPAGLKSLNVNEQQISPDQSGMFKIPVPSHPTSEPLRIAAIDKNDKHADLNIRLASEISAQETSTLGSSQNAQPEHLGDVEFGKFYAIVIGNNDYAAYPALKTAVSDAKSVDVILRERYRFTTKVLINATRHAIMTALNEINARLTEKDNLLIYYAGHGEIDSQNNNGYWLPTDAEVGNSANWISSQSITEWLSIMPAKHVIVVADSCYSGALSGAAIAKLPEKVDESKREKWLHVMSAHKARTVLTSGGVQPVLDDGGSGHSVFTNALLKILRSNRRVLEDYEIYRAVMDEVRSTSSRLGIKQVPQYAALQHAGHEGSPFFFVPEGT